MLEFEDLQTQRDFEESIMNYKIYDLPICGKHSEEEIIKERPYKKHIEGKIIREQTFIKINSLCFQKKAFGIQEPSQINILKTYYPTILTYPTSIGIVFYGWILKEL